MTSCYTTSNWLRVTIQRKYVTVLNPEIITRVRKKTLSNKLVTSRNPNQFLHHIQIQSGSEESITWEHKYNTRFQNHVRNWKHIYSLTVETTINTTLRSFPYRLLIWLIPRNTYLYLCKFTTNTICDFCSMNVESIGIIFENVHTHKLYGVTFFNI